MMKIGITGSTGFIGVFLKNFLSEKYSVVEIDLRNKTLDEYDFAGINTIVHLAGIAHKLKHTKDDEYYLINRDLAFRTAEKAKKEGVEHFIFISTAKVYGDISMNNEVFDERSVCRPKDAYAKSKYEAENLINNLSDNSFKVAIVRPPLVYGPGVKANMLNLINLTRKLPLIPLKGINNKRSIVYIGNFSCLVDRIIENKAFGIFLPTDYKPVSTSDMVSVIAKRFKKDNRLIGIPIFIIRLFNLCFPYYYKRIFGSFILNSDRTLTVLDFKMPYTTDYGISITVNWYLKK